MTEKKSRWYIDRFLNEKELAKLEELRHIYRQDKATKQKQEEAEAERLAQQQQEEEDQE